MASPAMSSEQTTDKQIPKQETTEEFSGRIARIIQSSLTPFGLAFGVKLGLFDSLASFDEPQTSEEIAKLNGYTERYIREWLGMMTVEHIIDYDPTTKTYWLPRHRRPAVSGIGGSSNVAVRAYMTAVAASSFSDLLQCVQIDGPSGIPFYEKNTGMGDALALIREDTWTSTLKKILQVVDGLLERLEKGIDVCEIGSSNGVISIMMAEQFPNSTFCGIDIEENAVKIALAKAEEKGLQNITFEVRDVCASSEWCHKFDFIIMKDVLHHLAYPTKVLGYLHRSMRAGSYLYIEEFNVESELSSNIKLPSAPYLYGASLLYCLPEASYLEDSEALGAVCGKENIKTMIEKAGFSVDKVDSYSLYAVFVCKKLEFPK